MFPNEQIRILYERFYCLLHGKLLVTTLVYAHGCSLDGTLDQSKQSCLVEVARLRVGQMGDHAFQNVSWQPLRTGVQIVQERKATVFLQASTEAAQQMAFADT